MYVKRPTLLAAIWATATLLFTACGNRVEPALSTLRSDVTTLSNENTRLKERLVGVEAAQKRTALEVAELRARITLLERRDTPTVPEATILGAWCAGSANAFHEEFSLEDENGVKTFSSWLHHGPAESGTWELTGRTFMIRGASEQLYLYNVVSATKDRLVLENERDGPEIYLRRGCRPIEEPFAEERKREGKVEAHP